MSSTFGGLNILSRSLYAQQASLDTVSHNIANAGTDGYSRQSVNLATASPAGEVYGRNKNFSGSGVTVASITRARDTFVDKQLWKESSALANSQASSDALSKLEGIFSEPSDTGIQTVLNQFWTAWQSLSTNASDFATRTAVAQRGVEVADAVQHAARQLTDTAENINFEVVSAVTKINQLTASIDKLNGQISFTEFSGTNHANDLRDSRDLLVDQLAELVDISVNEDSLGKYTIQSSGVVLVNGNGATKLGTVTTPNDPLVDAYGYAVTNVIVADTGKPLTFKSGEVAALIESRDSNLIGIKAYKASLEAVSQFLLQEFNAVHRSGYGTDNETLRNFFGAEDDGGIPPLDLDYLATYTTLAPPAGGWISALQVNPDINASSSGLRIIAARSAVSATVVTLPITNTGSGVPAVSSPTGTYDGTVTNVRVKVDTIDSSGKVSGISYSEDEGVTWSASITGTSPYTLPTIAGLDFSVDTSTLTSPAVDNTYNITLSTSSTASGIVAAAGSKNVGFQLPAVTTTGTYTGGSTATGLVVTVDSLDGLGNVNGITYSTNGGAPVTIGGAGPYTLPTIAGLTINIDTSMLTSPTATAGNAYSFTLSAGSNASGDNAISLGNSLKTDVSTILGNTTLDSYYAALIGTLGVRAQDAERTNTNQQTIVNQLTNLRESAAGVNMDEEMTNMIKFQKGYNAAARVLTAMDEMLDKLINSTGIVGR